MVDDVQDELAGAGGRSADARAVGAERGWGWLADGFGYFKRAPGVWIAMVVILGVILLVASFVPFIGPLAVSLATPIFMGGLMLACRRQDNGETPEIRDLFAGFKTRTNQLVVVGALYMGGTLVLMLVVGALAVAVGGSVMMDGMTAGSPGMGTAAGLGTGLLLVFLVLIALLVPLVMAVWFAPALVMFDAAEPIEAMKRSFLACLKNIVPFLVWGLLALVISMAAAIPFMLGFLVAGPVLIASAYVGYRDIFG